MVTIVLEPSSPDYKRWRDLVLLTLRRYALSDVADPSVYWVKLDNIVVTWILGTLSLELHEIVREPTETAHQSSVNSSATTSRVFYNSTLGSTPSNRAISASVTTVAG